MARYIISLYTYFIIVELTQDEKQVVKLSLVKPILLQASPHV